MEEELTHVEQGALARDDELGAQVDDDDEALPLTQMFIMGC